MASPIKITYKGDFKKTIHWLQKRKRLNILRSLNEYGMRGVQALSAATPVDTGLTAASWGYTIEPSEGSVTISWTNTNINDGVNVAVILQYGHGTGTGGYVEGIDYINPALKDIFQEIADAAWKEVTDA